MTSAAHNRDSFSSVEAVTYLPAHATPPFLPTLPLSFRVDIGQTAGYWAAVGHIQTAKLQAIDFIGVP